MNSWARFQADARERSPCYTRGGTEPERSAKIQASDLVAQSEYHRKQQFTFVCEISLRAAETEVRVDWVISVIKMINLSDFLMCDVQIASVWVDGVGGMVLVQVFCIGS